jgi:hypothetical protein
MIFPLIYQQLEEMFESWKGNSQAVRIHAMKAHRERGSVSPPTDDFKINQFIFHKH